MLWTSAENGQTKSYGKSKPDRISYMSYAFVSTARNKIKFTVTEPEHVNEGELLSDRCTYGTTFLPADTQEPEVLVFFGLRPGEYAYSLCR